MKTKSEIRWLLKMMAATKDYALSDDGGLEITPPDELAAREMAMETLEWVIGGKTPSLDALVTNFRAMEACGITMDDVKAKLSQDLRKRRR